MDLSYLDDETALLVVQFQLDDLQELQQSCGKGKHREGQTPDADLACEAFQAEVEAVRTSIADRNMSKSIAFAVIADAPAIRDAMALDAQETEDHRLAMSLSPDGAQTTGATQPNAHPLQALPDDLVNKYEARYVWDGDGTESLSGQAGPSNWAANRKATTLQKMSDCTACGESFRFFDLMHTPCGHEYCPSCIKQLFEKSLLDESLFPPRCCRQPIPADDNVVVLGRELIDQFKAKKIEFETTNRTYCSDPACSAFIVPTSIRGNMAPCAQCGKQTCVGCKQRYHGGLCTRDPTHLEVLELATAQGWQRCNKCNHVVELNQGCYHISKWSIFIVACSCLLLTRGFQHVFVEQNSATSAAWSGRTVHAVSGMKSASSTEPSKLSTGALIGP